MKTLDNIVRLGTGQKLHRQYAGSGPVICNGQNRRLQIVDEATAENLEKHQSKLCAKCWRTARVTRARAAANKAAAQAEARRRWEAGEETIVNFYGSDSEAGRGVGEITWAE